MTPAGRLGRAATLRGRSALPDLCFTETVHVADLTLRNIERLQRHGSVVVKLSGRWQYEHDQVGGWLQYVLNEATRIVTTLPEGNGEESTLKHGFDEALASQILQLLNKIYPASLSSPMDLKHQLDNIPDDRALMTALDALLGDGLISGRPLRDHTTGERRLAMLANIQITREGRRSLEPNPGLSSPAAVVQGDQYNISGSVVGAAGRGSFGNVQLQQSFSKNDALEALDALLSCLKRVQTRPRKQSGHNESFTRFGTKSRDEDTPDRSAVTKWLSKGKQLLAAAALSQEVYEAAHKVYELFGA